MKRPIPHLKYCKQNVVHVLRDYDRAVRMNYIALGSNKRDTNKKPIYHVEKYILLYRKRNPLTDARKNPEKLWETVKPDVFNILVQMLYEHEDREGNCLLTLWDSAAFYANDAAVFHSTNYFYKYQEPYNYESLKGRYRTFKIITTKDKRVLAGVLDIEYDPEENILTTTEDYLYEKEGQQIPYKYKGFMNFCDRASGSAQDLIWNDIDDNGFVRQTRLVRYTNANPTTMVGLSFFTFNNTDFHIRKVLIDNRIEGEDVFCADFDDKRIPERVRQDLTDSNSSEFKISRLKK